MTEELVGSAPPLKPGKTAHFVRYFMTADGWRSEIVVGLYLRRSARAFYIRDGRGETKELVRGTWEVCVP